MGSPRRSLWHRPAVPCSSWRRPSIPGGGTRSEPLTLPGFIHDVCSAVHPLGIGSPFFRGLPLAAHGLEWVQPPAAVAHPLDDGTAVLLERSTRATAAGLGRDGAAYRALMDPMVEHWQELLPEVLGPILHLPRHPLLLARFGLRALPPATWLARLLFREERARALFAGIAAHATLPLRRPPSAAFGMMLGLAGHAVGLAGATRRVQPHRRRPHLLPAIRWAARWSWTPQ